MSKINAFGSQTIFKNTSEGRFVSFFEGILEPGKYSLGVSQFDQLYGGKAGTDYGTGGFGFVSIDAKMEFQRLTDRHHSSQLDSKAQKVIYAYGNVGAGTSSRAVAKFFWVKRGLKFASHDAISLGRNTERLQWE